MRTLSACSTLLILGIGIGLALAGCGPTASDPGADAGDNQNQNGNTDDAGTNQNDAAPPTDTDGDGVPDSEDACPDDAQQWTDADGDGVCDEVDDACPGDDTGWSDSDGDGVCDEEADACPDDAQQWTDADGDGVCDEVDDDCPGDPNGWDDENGDGLCDGNDDSDGDGITNGEEEIYGADCAVSDPYAADSDGDGIDDNSDPYPRDPFPEYILHRNDDGTIDLSLSNRDGTFAAAVGIGAPWGCTADAPHNCPASSDTGYRYVSFVITDFDNNGRTDFLAVGDADTSDPSNPRDLWWFTRTGTINTGSPTSFDQRLVDSDLDENIFGTAADLNNDERIDLVALRITKPNYISDAFLYSYENTGLLHTATCAYTTDPANPGGCAFIRRQGADLYSLAYDEWNVGKARDAVDVDGDGFRDMVIYTMSSGGNVALPVYVLSGNGDGTFDVPSTPLFSHNSGGCGASPANSILFGDFDGDDLGDVILGLDDDGDPGSAWFYAGILTGGTFGFDFASCFEAFDINPSNESGADDPGVSSSARAFDFDFDGNLDVMLGWNHPNTWAPPSHTILLLGNGDGTFAAPTTVRDFPTTSYGNRFATPQRLCARFAITAP